MSVANVFFQLDIADPKKKRFSEVQIESEVFSGHLTGAANWEDDVFRFCTFSGLYEEGAHVTAAFVDCTFEGCEFYTALFNCATFVGVTFKSCHFRGCGFPGSRLAECTFDGCSFDADNFGGGCSFEESRWYACKQRGTQGLCIELAGA